MSPDEGETVWRVEEYERGLSDSLVALKATVEMMAEQVPQSMFSYRDFAGFIDLAIKRLEPKVPAGEFYPANQPFHNQRS